MRISSLKLLFSELVSACQLGRYWHKLRINLAQNDINVSTPLFFVIFCIELFSVSVKLWFYALEIWTSWYFSLHCHFCIHVMNHEFHDRNLWISSYSVNFLWFYINFVQIHFYFVKIMQQTTIFKYSIITGTTFSCSTRVTRTVTCRVTGRYSAPPCLDMART